MLKAISVKKGQQVFCAVMFNFTCKSARAFAVNTILHPKVKEQTKLGRVDSTPFGNVIVEFNVFFDPREGFYANAIYFGAQSSLGQSLDYNYVKSALEILSNPEVQEWFVPYRKLQTVPQDVEEVYIL